MIDWIKKNKKNVIIAGVVIVLIIVLSFILLFHNKKEEKKEEKNTVTNTYTMYVSINPLVKLVFTETYQECTNEKGEKSICSSIDNAITGYTLLNDDAKEFYHDLDFKEKSYLDALIMLCDTARDHNVGFQKIDIITNYKNASRENILKEIKEKGKYEVNFDVFLDVEEVLKEDEVIEDITKDEKLYTVTFDTNGGSKIDKRLAKENEPLHDLETPTKKGYIFVEWQLNGKTFSNETIVTKDITLKAIWKKEEAPSKPEEGEVKEETITKTIDVTNFKLKALNLYEDDKIFMDDARFMRYDSTIHVKITGLKSKVDAIKSSNIELGVDLSKYKTDCIGESEKIIVANPVTDITYEVTNPKVSFNLYAYKNVKSTIDKINLNENILVNEYDVWIPYCGSNYVVTNFEEVFKDYLRSDNKTTLNIVPDNSEDVKPNNGMIKESDFENLVKNLKEDTVAGGKIKSAFEKIKNTKYTNFINFSYEYANGSFTYQYQNLNISDYKIKRLANEFTKYHPIKNALSGIKVYQAAGACGKGPGDDELLTEELCVKYNINCSRW